MVDFVNGRQSTLYVYQDGEEVESIDLLQYDDKKALHALFQECGFVLKEADHDDDDVREDLMKQLLAEILEYQQQPPVTTETHPDNSSEQQQHQQQQPAKDDVDVPPEAQAAMVDPDPSVGEL